MDDMHYRIPAVTKACKGLAYAHVLIDFLYPKLIMFRALFRSSTIPPQSSSPNVHDVDRRDQPSPSAAPSTSADSVASSVTIVANREQAVRDRLVDAFRTGQLAVNNSGLEDAGFRARVLVSEDEIARDVNLLLQLRNEALGPRPEAFSEMIRVMNHMSNNVDGTGRIGAKAMIKDLLRRVDNLPNDDHAFTRSFLPLVPRIAELGREDALKSIKLLKWLLRRGPDTLKAQVGIALAGVVAPLYHNYINTLNAQAHAAAIPSNAAGQSTADIHGDQGAIVPPVIGEAVQQNHQARKKNKPSSLAPKVLVEHIKSYKGAVPENLRTACAAAIEAQWQYYGNKPIPKEKDIAAALASTPSRLDRTLGMFKRDRRW